MQTIQLIQKSYCWYSTQQTSAISLFLRFVLLLTVTACSYCCLMLIVTTEKQRESQVSYVLDHTVSRLLQLFFLCFMFCCCMMLIAAACTQLHLQTFYFFMISTRCLMMLSADTYYCNTYYKRSAASGVFANSPEKGEM